LNWYHIHRMWHEHLWNCHVLFRVHFSNLILLRPLFLFILIICVWSPPYLKYWWAG
jgi:hypothetical protein